MGCSQSKRRAGNSFVRTLDGVSENDFAGHDRRRQYKQTEVYFSSDRQTAGILLALCGVSLTATLTLKAQDEETTRRLWDTAFINSVSKKTLPRKATKRSYRISRPPLPHPIINFPARGATRIFQPLKPEIIGLAQIVAQTTKSYRRK